MIVRCPSCSSRREIPIPETARGGTLVDCADCGHAWIEGLALPVPSDPKHNVPAAPHADELAHRLMEATREAQRAFGRLRRLRRYKMAAWAGLAGVTIAFPTAAVAFPEYVVTAVPASIRLYELLGRDVNIYGLELRMVDVQHLVVDGRKVIAVKGEIVNTASSVRKIPWLRFGLRSTAGAEIYQWTLNTEVRPLKAGESTSFVTRLASPPEDARNLEIRFARADEIGSNAEHE